MPLRRALPLLVLVVALAVPVVAWAGHSPNHHHGSSGMLSILRGRGAVDLQAQGAVIGRIKQGKVKIKIYKGKHHKSDESQVVVKMRGKGTIRHKQDGTVVYNGRNIRIRIVDQKFRVQIKKGIGIHLSAVAQGTVSLEASGKAADPGVFALNGGDYQALPQDETTYQLGS